MPSAVNRVKINPELLVWARKRARIDVSDLVTRFAKFVEWERGIAHPTLRQLEDFANKVHVPIGYLFLKTPPIETLPVPDFRTLRGNNFDRPSPNLLDTIYLCQQRQEWYRDYARIQGNDPLDFVATVSQETPVVEIARTMRDRLEISIEDRKQIRTVTEALHQLSEKAESVGVLVMASSIVGSNSHRKLEVEEFCGFALVDDFAPLVFLNSADSKSAQTFTLAHELAHIWLGSSGVFDATTGAQPDDSNEQWCNAVAAEFLLPLADLHREYRLQSPLPDELQRLTRLFKVSTLVVLRRILDGGYIDLTEFKRVFETEMGRIKKLETAEGGGGDFYRTLGVRVGKRFARAVISYTLEGQSSFTEAFRMLGIRKTETFYRTAENLGVVR